MIRNLDNLIGNIQVCVFCILLLIFVILLNVRHLFSSKVPDKVGTGYVILWIVFTVYSCLYCPPGGDNYISLRNYYSYFGGIDKKSLHFEPIYFWLMDIFSFGYVTWRFAVWGLLGATSYVIISKLLHLDKHLSLIACFTFALPALFYYQRAACGYCLLYIAMAIYIDNPLGFSRNSKMWVSILISLTSLLFHTAMPFYLAVLIISMYTPITPKSLILIVVGMFLVSNSLFFYSDSFLSFMSEETQETGFRYLENAQVINRNFAGKLFEFINKIPVYYMVLWSLYQQIRGKLKLSKTEKVCLLNTLLLISVSLLFRDVSYVLEAKFYKASMVPFTLYLASFFPKIRGTRVASLFVIGTALFASLITFYQVSQGVFFYSL